MQITIATNEGQMHSLEVDGSMEVETLIALLEVDTGIPSHEQELFYLGKPLLNIKGTLDSYGVKDNEVLLLTRKPAASTGAIAGPSRTSMESEAEVARHQLLSNPTLQAELQRTLPDMLHAARTSPERFAQFYSNLRNMQQSASLSRQHNEELLNSDPYDVEAQRRIEEAIRQEAIAENFEKAIEWSPESFGRVVMLYVDMEVNGKPVKAFVDSGAQATIMSPQLAEECGIMRLVDKRFAGIAKGVGTAKILGRVHSAQIKVGGLFLHCSFTIMEGRGVDLLFGLDMLKRHQAVIDLRENVLMIQDVKIPFLAEHELPTSAFNEESELNDLNQPQASSSTIPSNPTQHSFPGAGNTLGGGGAGASIHGSSSSAQGASGSGGGGGGRSGEEEKIEALVNLGVTRAEAIKLLEQTGGDADMAASLLFTQFN